MSWFCSFWKAEKAEKGIPSAAVERGFAPPPDSCFDLALSTIPQRHWSWWAARDVNTQGSRRLSQLSQRWLSGHSSVGIVLVLILVACASAQNSSAKFRVSGKVVNAVNGHPLAGAEVWFGKSEDFEATEKRLLTGDDGAFAFTVSAPGKYLLSGQANGFRRQGFEQHGIYASAIVVGAQTNTGNVVFRLRPDARLLGMVEDDDHEPIGGATIYLFRTDANFGFRQTYLAEQTTTDDRGQYRIPHLEPGCYYLAASAAPWFGGLLQEADTAGNSAVSERPEFNVAYPTMFYPGVTDVASAKQIALNEGEDLTADFIMSPVAALRVRVNHLGGAFERFTNTTLQQRIFGTTINGVSMRQVRTDDFLEIRGVAPGRYLLDLESVDPSSRDSGAIVRSSTVMRLNLTEDVEVDPESASEVTPVRGVIRTGGGLHPKQPAYVRLWNSRSDDVLESNINEKGEINFDTTFLTPGTYSVYAMNGPNSIIGSLKATGAQVVGQTIQITGNKPVQLEIEMATSLSKISGVVRRDGQAVAGAMILLVPEEAETNLPKFRRDQSDSDGTFTLLDVLPGQYRMLAIEDGWDLEWANLSLLQKRLEHAQRIDVVPGKDYQAVVEEE